MLDKVFSAVKWAAVPAAGYALYRQAADTIGRLDADTITGAARKVTSDIGKGLFGGLADAAASIDTDEIAQTAEKLGRNAAKIWVGAAKSMSEAVQILNEEMAKSVTYNWGTSLVILGAIGAVSLTVNLGIQYIYHKAMANIGKPKMATEERRTRLWTPLTNALFKKKEEVQREAFFAPKIKERIEQIAQSTKNIKANNAYFQNVVLYGPPGTGKTMVAKKIAEESDMDFILMSAGNLTQFIKRKEHVSELNNLFDSAEAGSKPVVIFIDEAEGLTKKRGELDQEHLELLNAYLARTGTPSKKIMMILATNRVDDLDNAVLDRMSHKIEVGYPAFEQRVAIINQYAKELFAQSSNYEKFFHVEAIKTIAKKTEGLSGRSLFQMVNALSALESTQKNRELTQKLVDDTIDNFVSQKRFSSETKK